MKKQAAKTITTLSLFVALSVGVCNVPAFAWCRTNYCGTKAEYPAAAPVKPANLATVEVAGQAPAQETSVESSVGLSPLFWTRMLTLIVFFF